MIGRPTRASICIGRAMMAAIPSGSVRARRLGTNSPRIKDTVRDAHDYNGERQWFGKQGNRRDLLESLAHMTCDGRLPEGAAQNPNTRDAYLHAGEKARWLGCQRERLCGACAARINHADQSNTPRADDRDFRQREGATDRQSAPVSAGYRSAWL